MEHGTSMCSSVCVRYIVVFIAVLLLAASVLSKTLKRQDELIANHCEQNENKGLSESINKRRLILIATPKFDRENSTIFTVPVVRAVYFAMSRHRWRHTNYQIPILKYAAFVRSHFLFIRSTHIYCLPP